jgi:hypothetical protein
LRRLPFTEILPEVFTTRTADSGNYGKFSKRSNRILPKMKKVFCTRQKTLRPAADFGFILPCRFNRQPVRQWQAAAA